MKTIVDRVSKATVLASIAGLVAVFVLAPANLHNKLVLMLFFSINSAGFARSAYGTSPPFHSRELSLAGFWLSLLATIISALVLFAGGA